VIGGPREFARTAFQIGKVSIITILFKLVELIFEKTIKRHRGFLSFA
jgi:hypothetical protein